jgi:hypothetical protein
MGFEIQPWKIMLAGFVLSAFIGTAVILSLDAVLLAANFVLFVAPTALEFTAERPAVSLIIFGGMLVLGLLWCRE